MTMHLTHTGLQHMSTSKMKDLPVTRISDSFFSDTDHSDCKI